MTESRKWIYDLVERLQVYENEPLFSKVKKIEENQKLADWSTILSYRQEEEYKPSTIPPFCNFESHELLVKFLHAITKAVTRHIQADRERQTGRYPESRVEIFVNEQKEAIYLRSHDYISTWQHNNPQEDPVARVINRFIIDLVEIETAIKKALGLTVYNWKIINPVGESPVNLPGIWAKQTQERIDFGIAYQFIKRGLYTDEELIRKMEM